MSVPSNSIDGHLLSCSVSEGRYNIFGDMLFVNVYIDDVALGSESNIELFYCLDIISRKYPNEQLYINFCRYLLKTFRLNVFRYTFNKNAVWGDSKTI